MNITHYYTQTHNNLNQSMQQSDGNLVKGSVESIAARLMKNQQSKYNSNLNNTLQGQTNPELNNYENINSQMMNHSNVNSSLMSATATNGFMKFSQNNVKIPGQRQIPLNKFSRGGPRQSFNPANKRVTSINFYNSKNSQNMNKSVIS